MYPSSTRNMRSAQDLGVQPCSSKTFRWLVPLQSLPGAAVLAFVVLLADYATGPFIRFPVLLVAPVAIASWFHSGRWGFVSAISLSALHMVVEFAHQAPWSLATVGVNGLVLAIVLSLFAFLIDLAAERRRLAEEVRILRGLLPICSFCKRIENTDGTWEVMETYIAERTEAEFTHSICPPCAWEHYHIDLQEVHSRGLGGTRPEGTGQKGE